MKTKITLFCAVTALLTGSIYLYSTSENTLFSPVTAALPEAASPDNQSRSSHKFAAREGAAVQGAGSPDRLAALEKDMADLKLQLARLQGELAARRTHVDPAADRAQVPPDPAKAAERIAELRAQEDKQQQEQGKWLETSFQQQTVNPNWSVKTKKLILDSLAADNVGSGDIVDIDCRATMCRVELTNDGDHPAPKISSFPMLVGQDLPNIRVNQLTEQDGSTTTLLYLSREDFAEDGGKS